MVQAYLRPEYFRFLVFGGLNYGSYFFEAKIPQISDFGMVKNGSCFYQARIS